MIYVTYGNAGELTGLYRQPLNPAHITSHIQVADEIAANWTAYEANAGRSGVVLSAGRMLAVPQVVSKFQAKAALLNAGHLTSIETIMSNPATPALTKLAWTEAQEFVRTSPIVASMAIALSLTPAQVDALFRYAATVSA